jgi:hypothetical protein
VLGIVFVSEHINCCLRRRAGRRGVNLAKIDLHVDLDREGDLVQYVGGLVNPTPLVSGARKDLHDRLPEAERAVADREVRRCFEATLLEDAEEDSEAAAVSGLRCPDLLVLRAACEGSGGPGRAARRGGGELR